MNFINLSLENTGKITHSLFGDFSGNGVIELLIVRSQTTIELYRINENDQVSLILQESVFCMIRSMCKIRIGSEAKDYILIGSDSGSITLLGYSSEQNKLIPIYNEIFGKSGIRRVVPGEYICSDPMGRAAMIGAIEKQKLVYIFNRDSNGKITISSPLEAHKSNTICYNIIALNVGYDNPMFATIEVDYNEQYLSHIEHRIIKKYVVFYELDLGLNHVIRKVAEPIDPTSNYLIPILSLNEGYHYGLFICSEDKITWFNIGHDKICIPIPKYHNQSNTHSTLITSHVMRTHKGKHFVLLQSEFGDLFQLSFDIKEKGQLDNIHLRYFDSIPTALSLQFSKRGHFLCVGEYGDSILYNIISMENITIPFEKDGRLEFERHKEILNLEEIYRFKSLAPLIDLKVAPATSSQDTTKMYAFCGKGNQSTIKILKNQLNTLDAVEIELPAIPISIWPLKKETDEYHQYLAISYSNITTLLKITEDEMSECTTSPILLSTPSLLVSMLFDGTFLQVMTDRIIIYSEPIQQFITEDQKYVCASCNGSELIVSVEKNNQTSLIYFQYQSGHLLTMERKDNLSKITALALDQFHPSKHCAIGCIDGSVHLLSLIPNETTKALSRVSLQTYECSINSLTFNIIDNTSYLFAGLSNGLLGRSVYDPISGEINESSLNFVGSRPVTLSNVKDCGEDSVLAISGRSLLSYKNGTKIKTTPLNIQNTTLACGILVPFVDNAIAIICEKVMKIITIESTSSSLTGKNIQISYTPRKVITHPTIPLLYILEGDNNSCKVGNEIIQTNEGNWVGGIHTLDASQDELIQFIDFDNNKHPTGGCVVRSISKNQTYLIVGVIESYKTRPIQWKSSEIQVYSINERSINYCYSTKVEYPVRAFAEFKGMVLAGVGNILRLYDIGLKSLLKKAEKRQFASDIAQLHVIGETILLTGVSDGFNLIRYNQINHKFDIYADSLPRWVVTAAPLNQSTVLASDKFGEIFMYQLPKEIEEQALNPFSTLLQPHKTIYEGSSYKMVTATQFFVGDIATSFAQCSLIPGAPSIFLYSNFMGGLSALIPLQSQNDIDFYQHLEMHMRVHWTNLTDRNHISFRSSIVPVKDTVDGDLCELYERLPYEIQQEIAEEMEKEVNEIIKKLHDLRHSRLF
ncbi:hypothetical protein ENUP19_0388G0004 [Entamoeba nuttalli]|uniref:CPSF A subunit region protein, putative n=2 Tax=Entamoeba nuttalli TaxID=412467 RepID=K2HHC3_ENTNP|nr:CPSF A subunit region protein, putative [Entamoeba nuttalli P19]EKE42344.1 CPSF A subunit region protein, putative [Entamoeba nuttalli P19]|eukprot:XP_008855319.1 CPSF A subunit region protein, putative [Entamoeba nuttalli P19]